MLLVIAWCACLALAAFALKSWRVTHNADASTGQQFAHGRFAGRADGIAFRAIVHRGRVIARVDRQRLISATPDGSVTPQSPQYRREFWGDEPAAETVQWTVTSETTALPPRTTTLDLGGLDEVITGATQHDKKASVFAWTWLLYPRKLTALAVSCVLLGLGMTALTTLAHNETVRVEHVQVTSEEEYFCDFSLSMSAGEAVGPHTSACPKDGDQKVGDSVRAVALPNSSYAILVDDSGLSLVAFLSFAAAALCAAAALPLTLWRTVVPRHAATISDTPLTWWRPIAPHAGGTFSEQPVAWDSDEQMSEDETVPLTWDEIRALAEQLDAAQGHPVVRNAFMSQRVGKAAAFVPWSAIGLLLLAMAWYPEHTTLTLVVGSFAGLIVLNRSISAIRDALVHHRLAAQPWRPVEVIRIDATDGHSTIAFQFNDQLWSAHVFGVFPLTARAEMKFEPPSLTGEEVADDDYAFAAFQIQLDGQKWTTLGDAMTLPTWEQHDWRGYVCDHTSAGVRGDSDGPKSGA